MKEFWNERYSKQEYAYGTRPNEYLKSQLLKLKPGRILFPAEGEGRNAVYAATLGWDVVAFDTSEEGQRKALALANENGVSIDYRLLGYDSFEDAPASYDAIGLVFAHTDPSKRATYHRYFIELLNQGGHVILQGFTPAQLHHSSGGPGRLDMLYTPEMLRDDFKTLSEINVTEDDVELNEGIFHIGSAAVIGLFGTK